MFNTSAAADFKCRANSAAPKVCEDAAWRQTGGGEGVFWQQRWRPVTLEFPEELSAGPMHIRSLSGRSHVLLGSPAHMSAAAGQMPSCSPLGPHQARTARRMIVSSHLRTRLRSGRKQAAARGPPPLPRAAADSASSGGGAASAAAQPSFLDNPAIAKREALRLFYMAPTSEAQAAAAQQAVALGDLGVRCVHVALPPPGWISVVGWGSPKRRST